MPASMTGIVAVLLATGVLSALLTGFAIRYARNKRLLDLPGQRRSHSVPTPRGGGIGIVIAVFACLTSAGLLLAPVTLPACLVAALALAIAVVAAVGWIDDHRGLSARWRFTAHGLAALCLIAAGLAAPVQALIFGSDAGSIAMILVAALVWLAIVWSINLHNFMDGIDGILSVQAIFVFAVLAALGLRDSLAAAFWPAAFAAATLGFLPFNFPRARIFMGDVGSGVLGLLVAVAVLWQIGNPRVAAWSGVVACSAFLTDATCTLLSRMWRGRRWYSAHREHLYQWLVRCGYSHARVVALYLGWNLLLVLPVIYWMNRSVATASPSSGLAAAVALHAVAVVVWFVGKRACLRHVRLRGTDAAA